MGDGIEAHHLQHCETEKDEENLQLTLKAWELTNSLVLSMLVRSACELGIPEVLHEAAGPLSAHQIAQKLQTRPLQLYHDEDEGEGRRGSPDASQRAVSAADLDRVLLCLAAHGVFGASSSENTGAGTIVYHSTRLSSWLLPDLHEPQQEVPPSLLASSATIAGAPSPDTHHSFRGMFMLFTNPAYVKSWLHLSPFLAHGLPHPFLRANSIDLWEFALRNPSFGSLYDGAMSSDSVSLTTLLCRYKGFAEIRSLVDLGGCDGVAASHIATAYPSLKVTCFDLPNVIARNTAKFSGVDYVGGDMFQSVPEADAIFMKRVLHCWSDDDCIKILRNCHKALPIGGKLIIMEWVYDVNLKEINMLSKLKAMTDVWLLALTNGGKARTIQQYKVLFANSNFSIQKVIDLPSAVSVIEAISMESGNADRMEVSP